MEWFNEKNDILVEDMDGLMEIANTPQFGECEDETLTRFLLCQAFEVRFDPAMARAFRLAAMIISRVPNVEVSGGRGPSAGA